MSRELRKKCILREQSVRGSNKTVNQHNHVVCTRRMACCRIVFFFSKREKKTQKNIKNRRITVSTKKKKKNQNLFRNWKGLESVDKRMNDSNK